MSAQSFCSYRTCVSFLNGQVNPSNNNSDDIFGMIILRHSDATYIRYLDNENHLKCEKLRNGMTYSTQTASVFRSSSFAIVCKLTIHLASGAMNPAPGAH